MKRTIQPLAMIALFAALFVAWQVYGQQGAYNVIRFWVYAAAILGALALFITPSKPMTARPALIGFLIGAGNLATIVALAWVGKLDFASFWTFSTIAGSIYREKAARTTAKASA